MHVFKSREGGLAIKDFTTEANGLFDTRFELSVKFAAFLSIFRGTKN
jgi:hypothetical protein